MGSGLVSLAWLISGLKYTPTAKGIFVVSTLLFCWGAYKAWSKQFDEVQSERAKNIKPEIKIAIKKGYIERIELPSRFIWLSQLLENDMNLDGIKTLSSLILLDLDIYNCRPVPTTIRPPLELLINTGGKSYRCHFIPGEPMIGFQVSTYHLSTIPGADIKTPIDHEIISDKPLVYGCHRPCWAWFYCEDLEPYDYKGAIVNLRVQDGTGTWHPARETVNFTRGAIRPKILNGIKISDE
jgi:hypothetical protein